MASANNRHGLFGISISSGALRSIAWAAAFAALVLLAAGTAQAAITQTDAGWQYGLNTTQNNTFTIPALNAGANMLVVEISSRSTTVNDLPQGSSAALTFGGTQLTAAVLSEGTGSTYVNSGIYYMPITNWTSQSLVVNFPSALNSNDAIDVFTLGGVNTGVAPITATVGNTELSYTSIALTVSGVTAGAAAIGESTYRDGTQTLPTTTLSGPAAAGGTLSATGTGGGNGNLWSYNDGNIYASGSVATGFTTASAASLTQTITAAGGAATHWSDALAVFTAKPLTVGNIWAGGTVGFVTDWNTAGNWSSGVPVASQTITLGNTGAQATANLSAAGTAGNIVFLNNVNTTVQSTGGYALTLDHGGSTTLSVTSAGTQAINTAINLNDNANFIISSGTVTLGGNISNGSNGSKGISLDPTNVGTLALAGSNGYTGATSVPAGTLSLQGPGAISASAITVSGGSLVQTAAGAGGISNTASLNVTGGTATLSQANNYSGGTTVSGTGTLLATNTSGSANGGNPVAVNSGGTLGGSGSIGGLVTVASGGFLAPGATASSFTTLHVGSLAVQAGGDFNFNVGAANASDEVVVNGSLNLAGSETINVAFPNGLAAGTYQIIQPGLGGTTDTASFTVSGTAAESYTLLRPGQGSNSTTAYELQTSILTATWVGNSGGSYAWDTSVTNWNVAGGGNQFVTGMPVVFDDTGANASPVTIATNVSPFSVSFNNSSAHPYTIGGAAGIAGTGTTLALTNGGTVILTGPNTYTGSTTIGVGATLQIGNGGTVGSIAAASAISNSGTLAIDRNDSSAIFWTTGLTPYALASNISGNGGVTINGGGYLGLTGTNSYYGQTYIQDGYLALSAAGNLGNTSGILIGDTTGIGAAGIYNNTAAAMVINQNIHVQAGSSGAAYIGSNVQNGTGALTTYNGSLQIDKPTHLANGYHGTLTMTGPISSGVSVTGANLYLDLGNNAGQGIILTNSSMTFSGNTYIGQDNTDYGGNLSGHYASWNIAPATNATLNTSFGTGTINVYNGAGFDWEVSPVTGSGTNVATLTNNVVVDTTGGVLTGLQNGTLETITYSGNIALNGRLQVGGAGVGTYVNTNAQPTTYSGTVTVGQSTLAPVAVAPVNGGTATGSALNLPGFWLYRGNSNGGEFSPAANITGNIVSGTGNYPTPLFLGEVTANLPIDPTGGNNLGPIAIAGTANTYTSGTVLYAGVVSVGAASSLGNGPTYVEGSSLQSTGGLGTLLALGAASNINTAAGGSLNMAAYPQQSLVSLTANFAPTFLSSTSQGVLAIDSANNSITSEAALGNGYMFLGSTSGGTISNTAVVGLLPGANAPTPGTAVSAPTYRLGGGGYMYASNGVAGTLNVTNSILADTGAGSSNLIVGQPGGLIIGSSTVGYGIPNGQGIVKLNANQPLTGTISVYGGNTGGCCNAYNTVTLESVIQPSGQPFGTGANTMVLNGGSVQFENTTASTAARTDLTIGDLDVNGGYSTFGFDGTQYNDVLTINGPNGIVRNNNASLFLNVTNTGLGTNGKIMVAANIGNANSANGSRGMVTVGGVPAPWIQTYANHGGGDFVAYTANGLMPTTYTVNGVVANVTDAAASTLFMNNTVATDIVALNISGNDTSLIADKTIYALKTIKASGTAGIVQGGAGTTPINLILTSGGLAVDEQNGSLTIGTQTASGGTGQVNVVFGSLAAPVEGVIWGGMYNAVTNTNIYNHITAQGLTVSGWGQLNLGYTNNSYVAGSGTFTGIQGPVTIDGGILATSNSGGAGTGELGIGSPTGANASYVVLNGGQWSANSGGTIQHNISMGAAGGILSVNGTTVYSGSITDLSTLPTGVSAGPLTINVNGNNLTLTNTTGGTNNWSGSTIIQGTGSTNQVIVPNGVSFGTGSVSVASGALTLQGNSNLGANATLGVNYGAQANVQYNGTTTIGALDGAGSLVLGTTAVASTLQVGGSNASTTWAGTISQASNTYPGALTFNGTGTFTIMGGQTYTGPTTISNGTVLLNGSLAAGSSVGVGAARLGGTGVVNGPVTLNGGSSIIGGNSLTTPGTLTLASTLNVASGANTLNSGTVAVAGASTIASGATLTVSGTLSNTAAVTVAGTLTNLGSGSIGGPVSVSSLGQLNPAGTATIGSMGVGSLALGSGSILDIDTGLANASDIVNVAALGSLSNGGSVSVNLSNNTQAGTFSIIGYSGASNTLNPAQFSVSDPGGGASYTFGWSGNDLQLIVGTTTSQTWNGGSATSSNWSAAANWGGTAPANGSALSFDGTTRLSNTNDYGSGGASPAGKLTVTGITFNATAGAFVLGGTNALTLDGSLVAGGTSSTPSNIINTSPSVETINMPLVLNTPLLVTVGASAGNVVLGGVISDGSNGPANVTVSGLGRTVVLNNTANTYSGVTTISGGAILSVSNLAADFSGGDVPSSVGWSTGFSNNLVIDGGTLRYTGGTASSPRGFTMTPGGATLDASGSGPINFTYSGLGFSGAGPRTLTLTGSNTGLNTLGTVISDVDGTPGDSTTLTKAGTGTWFVSVTNGGNTFTGPVNLNGGVLAFDGLAALGNGTAINFNGGTLQWDPNTDDISGRTVSILAGGATFDLQGNNVNIGNPIGNGGSGSLTKLGSGTLALNAAATYTGGTNINQGTLQTGIANALPASGVVSLGAAATNGTLDLDGFSQTVGGLSSANAGTPASQIVGNSSTLNNATITVAGSGTSTFNGIIKDALPGGSKTTALAVTSGTLNLGGANTLSGGVTVSGTGTLNANSASALGPSTGTVNVSGSGALNLSTGITLANGNFTGGTVNTNGNSVAVTGQMQTAGYKFAYTPGGSATSFSVTGANLANDSTARTITLSGGVLSVPTITDPGQLAARWNSVSGSSLANGGNNAGIPAANFVGAVTTATGPFGAANGAVAFNGVNTTYLSVPNFNSAMDFSTTSFTASMWVKWNNTANAGANAYARFWADKETAWNDPYGWEVQRDNENYGIQAHTANGSSGAATDWTWGTDPSQPGWSPWFLLTMAVTEGVGANSTSVSYYQNGTLLSTTNGLQNIQQSTANFLIGHGPDASGDPWNGEVADVRLYNAALTQAQVQSIYNSGAGDAGGAVTLPNTNISLTASSTLSLGTPTLGNLTLTNAGTSLAITGGATSATFANITATGVGSAPGGTISGISALTVSGSSINVTNSTDLLTLPSTTFTASPVTLNGAGAGKLVLGNAATFSPAGGTLNVSAGTLQFTPAVAASSINGSLNIATGAVLSPMAGTLSVTAGGTLTLNPASIYRWTYTDDADYSWLNATAGSLVLPPSATPPVLQLSFSTAPAASPSHPYILASWTTPPTNEPPTWTVDNSLLSSSSYVWTDGTSGSLSTPGNWGKVTYTGATLLYTPTQLQLVGLTLGVGSAPSSIPTNASLTIGSSSTGASVVVTGPTSLMTIASLTVGDPTKAPATATVNLQSGGNLNATSAISVSSPGTLTTAGANVSTATFGSSGTVNVTGASTLTAANLNVFGGTTTFGPSSTAAVTTATVSLAGQLAMKGGGTIGTLDVTGTGPLGVTIGGTTVVNALAASGGTTTFSDPTLSTVSVSSPAVVNFNGPTTNITDTTTGLTVSGGNVTFGTGAGSTSGTIALLGVSGGTVALDSQTVTTANLSGGSTTVPSGSTGSLGSTALNLSGTANLTVAGGTVGGASGTVTFASTYSGTATFDPAVTIQTGTATQTIADPLTVPIANISIPTGATGVVYLNNTNDLTALAVGGGTVTRNGNVHEGTGNLPAAAGASGATTVSGGGLTMIGNTDSANVSGGSFGLTGNVAGTATVSNGSLGLTGNAANIAQSGGTITLAGNVTGAANISAGTFGATSGTIAQLGLSAGSTGSATTSAPVTVSYATVNGGTAAFNGPVGSLSASAGTTNVNGGLSGDLTTTGGAVIFAAAPSVGTANLQTGTVTIPGNTLTVGSQLQTSGGIYTASAGAFGVTGANVAATRSIVANGGTVYANPTAANLISVFFQGNPGQNLEPAITGPAGVAPLTTTNWNNVQGYWYETWGSATGAAGALHDNHNVATDVTVADSGAAGGGYGWYNFPTGSAQPLLSIALGGQPPLPLVINNIPYSSYSIVAYVNNGYGGNETAAIASTGATYYFSANPAGDAFVPITNTTSGTYPAGNYVVFSGLTGTSQTLFATSTNNNGMYNGFQIVDTSSTPSVTDPNTGVTATASSILNAGGGTPTLGDISVTNGSTLTLANATSITLGNITLAAGTTLDAATNSIRVTAAGLYDANGSTAGEQIHMGGNTLTIAGATPPATFSGVISTTAASALVMNGPGTQVLKGSNNYTGTTTVNGGTLSIAADNNLGTGGGIVLNGGALSASATFELNHLRGIVVGPATVGTGSGTLDVAPGAILTYNGVISDNSSTTPGAIGALIKTGAGELKLGGTGTYTGNTSVEDGLLVIDSSEAILSGSTVATTPNAAIVLGDPSLPSDGTSLGGLVPGSGGGLAASPNVVPEPGTLALLAAACGFAMLWLRRKGRR